MARTLSEAEYEQVKAHVLAALPDNLREDEFPRVVGPRMAAALAEAENTPAAPEGSALGRLAWNAGGMLNPVTAVKGLYGALQDPIGTGQRMGAASRAEAGKAVDAYRQGRYSEMLGHAAAVVPLIGPAAAAAGEQISSGDVAGGFGTGLGLIGSILAPSAVKAVAGAAPLQAARTAVADVVGGQAVPLARAGVKAPLALLKQQAGASMEGVNLGANRLAKFLIDNRITTPGQAARIIKNTEATLQNILATKGDVPTDAPQRAQLYLDILEQKAAQAINPDHAATVRAAAADLIAQSPLGETVTTTVMRPSPTGVVDASGQPVMAPVQETTRALRPDVPAAEALDIARTTSQFETRRSWGEQKGTAMEATKAQERAVRDAFKIALPETRTPLEQQGRAILAEKVLDRDVWRRANRDVIGLPGLVGLSANAVVGFAAHWLRNNQLRAGIWADQLATAIRTQNAPATAGILSRLGVRLPALGPLLEGLPAGVGSAIPAATADQGTPP